MLVLLTLHFLCLYSMKFVRTQQTLKSKLTVIYTRMTFLETSARARVQIGILTLKGY